MTSNRHQSIRLTIDVENLSGSITDPNFANSLEPLLDAIEETNAKATFFVVGSLASVWKKKIQQLSNNGHEIALHGHTHEFLPLLGPKKFAEELLDGKNAIEDAIGKEVSGFRAPYFSLTNESLWAPDILHEAGFKFSSSVLPAWNPQAGFPQAPRKPFLWKCGLVEFPVPTFGIGFLRVPLLGGAYLRLSPQGVFNMARYFGSRRAGEWAYCHPYDFDVNAKFEVVRETSWAFSKLLFARRNLMLPRVQALTMIGTSNSIESRTANQVFLNSLKVFPKGQRGIA